MIWSCIIGCIIGLYNWSTLNLQALKLGGYHSRKHRFVYEFHVVHAATLPHASCVCSNQHLDGLNEATPVCAVHVLIGLLRQLCVWMGMWSRSVPAQMSCQRQYSAWQVKVAGRGESEIE